MTMLADNPAAAETLRKSDLATLAALLESQRVRSVDVTLPANRLYSASGQILISNVEPVPQDDGVTDVNGLYALGEVALEALGARLDMGRQYTKRLHADAKPLFDENVNYWLRGELGGMAVEGATGDSRKFLARLLLADTGDSEVSGMIRTFLSDSYLALDNLDILVEVMNGLAEAGISPRDARIETDLTERRMVVKVWVPTLAVLAPVLLGKYRSPFTGESGKDFPQVFAGFVFSNSEVGLGAWSIAPRLVFKVCTNGMTITRDALSKTHLGAKLDEGVVKWSAATQRAHLALIKSKTADAVRTFLDVEYMQEKIAAMEEQAATPTVGEPEKVIRAVTRHTGHSGSADAVLRMFIMGADLTAGGVMNAYTAAAQDTRSGDVALDLENNAIKAMEYAASHVR